MSESLFSHIFLSNILLLWSLYYKTNKNTNSWQELLHETHVLFSIPLALDRWIFAHNFCIVYPFLFEMTVHVGVVEIK